MSAPAVEVSDVSFRYGDVPALDGVSFTVSRGEVFCLLGPNGGGKTTLFRILATLLRPASGSARILGRGVAAEPAEVRRMIGVVFQNQSLDRRLTAAENLLHQGRLYGLRGALLRRRIDEALERVGLAARRDAVVEKLSGGQRRRVELAKGLLHQPELLLLDEPSTGVDPAARLDFWRYLQALRREEGVTVLLTTHLLDEADKCDRVAILDRGRIVTEGSPAQLKAEVGGDVVVMTAEQPETLLAQLSEKFQISARLVDERIRFEHERGGELAARIKDSLEDQIESVTVSRPTLEDVFIRRTGHRLEGGAGLE